MPPAARTRSAAAVLSLRASPGRPSRTQRQEPTCHTAGGGPQPPDGGFTVVEGAAHAQFGDYGPQPGDGTPTISDDEARDLNSWAAVEFVDGLSP